MANSTQSKQTFITTLLNKKVIIPLVIIISVVVISIIIFIANQPSDTERYVLVKADIKQTFQTQDKLSEIKDQKEKSEKIITTSKQALKARDELNKINCDNVKQNEAECFKLKSLVNRNFKFFEYMIYLDKKYSYEEISTNKISEEDKKESEKLIGNGNSSKEYQTYRSEMREITQLVN